MKLFVAAKAFIIRDGKVLIIRESDKYQDGIRKGKYDVVGGRLTPGESLAVCLKREVKEETNLDIEIGKPFFVNEAWPNIRGEEWQIVRIFFECSPLCEEVVLSGDHDAFLWIDPKAYNHYDLFENLIPVFEQYLEIKSS